VVGVYIAPNEDMQVIESLAARTVFTGNSTKRSNIGGDLNIPTQTGMETRVEIVQLRHL